MALKDPRAAAQKALAKLDKDRTERLLKIDRYERGEQDLPYTPESADAEYLQLAERSITNVIKFMVATPGQMLAVDSFRRGRTSGGSDLAAARTRVDATKAVQPEWDHWQKSGMDARQGAVHYGALKFGHSFVLTEKDPKRGVLSKGLSALRTIAMYDDAFNDDDPVMAITVTKWPEGDERGQARMFDDTNEYRVSFKSLPDTDSVRVGKGRRHGAKRCPITRFAAAIDLEGRTVGVVEPMLTIQDRINQTVFDLLIVQSFASFKVRTISGMAPPIKLKALDANGNTIPDPTAVPEDTIAEWVPEIDPSTGRPIPDEVNLNAKRLLFAEDHETKFGTLDETPLDGFIAAIDLGFRHMAALSQTPPHHILGQISNLSAEALNAAETALTRKVSEFKRQFGESWERVFRVAAEIGDYDGADDFSGEAIWRDMENVSMAQIGDALGKLAESLGIPKRGLWPRVPGVTATELAEWNELYGEDNPEVAAAKAGKAAGTSGRPALAVPDEPATPGKVAAA